LVEQQAPDRRLVGFLAVSLALHLLWLAVPLSSGGTAPAAATPIIAHLAPRLERPLEPPHLDPAPHKPAPNTPTQKSAVAGRLSVAAPATVTEATIAPAPATPRINLDAAAATARAYAREAQPRTSLDAPKPVPTVETAIARATEPDVIVESRGPNGELVTKSKHSRCVTPLVVPHYLEGMTVPTLCN
jgi:hypothetical protein